MLIDNAAIAVVGLMHFGIAGAEMFPAFPSSTWERPWERNSISQGGSVCGRRNASVPVSAETHRTSRKVFQGTKSVPPSTGFSEDIQPAAIIPPAFRRKPQTIY